MKCSTMWQFIWVYTVWLHYYNLKLQKYKMILKFWRVMVLCSWARHFIHCLVLVQPRKIYPTWLKNCWMEPNKQNKICHIVNALIFQKLVLFSCHLSCGMRFPTMWHVWPAKAQTSLSIHADWSEPLLVV